LAAITRQFTSYYLHYGETEDTLYTNGGLGVGVCFPESFQNNTHRILSSQVQNSVRIEYVNRVLTREQISWRNRSDEKPKKALPSTKSAVSSIDQNLNVTDTTEQGTNTTAPAEPEADKDDKDKNNKIHNHLVFVMLLPHHPYSQELRKIITTVTPMFPLATIVVGNAYEFKDMTTKYYVTSFPKILYFRSGIYLEAFEGAYTAEDVAAQLADWTYSLPQAVPVPFSRTRLARRSARLSRQLDVYAPGGQMRYGLALQPLPLTVQYTLVNVTVQLPQWAMRYVPWLHATSVNTTTASTNAGAGGSDGANGLVLPVVAAPEVDVESEVVESVTSVNGPGSTESGTTGGDSGPGSVSIIGSEDSGYHPPIHTALHTPRTTYHTHYIEVPIQLSVTVPMPNVEPFLGSLENYAVWDTRMFLLAGLYVIMRVLFLLRKWVAGAV